MRQAIRAGRAIMTVGVTLVTACGKPKATPPAPPPPAVEVAAGSITIVDSALVERGPALSGTLTAERSAQLRAQTSGTLMAVNVDAGSAVSAGMPIAVIDTFALAEAARSARAQLASAQAAADVAKRNVDRLQALHQAGAIADRDLELARNQSVAAEAMVADAQSRVTSATRQLANAIVRAPFAGVISERPANTGDVVQMGSPIATLVDPASLQLEASVPADQMSSIRRGAKVEFSVTGMPGRTFTGTIARINPAVDPATRQVRLYVSVANAGSAIATGSFAEGRVASASKRTLSIPIAALDTRAATTSVKRVRGGVVESVPVTLGLRDDVAERVEVLSGLQRGDTLLVGGVLTTPAGTKLNITNANR